jgi:hypothetical protein
MDSLTACRLSPKIPRFSIFSESTFAFQNYFPLRLMNPICHRLRFGCRLSWNWVFFLFLLFFGALKVTFSVRCCYSTSVVWLCFWLCCQSWKRFLRRSRRQHWPIFDILLIFFSLFWFFKVPWFSFKWPLKHSGFFHHWLSFHPDKSQ